MKDDAVAVGVAHVAEHARDGVAAAHDEPHVDAAIVVAVDEHRRGVPGARPRHEALEEPLERGATVGLHDGLHVGVHGPQHVGGGA